MRTSLRQYVLHNQPSQDELRRRLAAVARATCGGGSVLTPDDVLVDDRGGVMLPTADDRARRPVPFLEADPRAYLAPECIRGQESTEAAAVYSLGAICWEMLAGRLPYDVECLEPDEALAVLAERPADTAALPAGVDEALARVLRTALSPEADERPKAAQVADALAGRKARRRVCVALALLCLLAAGVCLTLAVMWW